MSRSIRGFLALMILCAGAACSAAAGGGSTSTRATLISFEEIQARGPFSNLFDLVQVMRPRWLRSQGPDTLTGQQGQVQVHMDGNRLGTVDVLRNVAASGVTSVRWLPPMDASARYGLDHTHGAIVISTAPAD
jgi:hypothetical protein